MSFSLEDNFPFIDEDDQEEEICIRQEVESNSIQAQIEEEDENKTLSFSKRPSLTANISNGSFDSIIRFPQQSNKMKRE